LPTVDLTVCVRLSSYACPSTRSMSQLHGKDYSSVILPSTVCLCVCKDRQWLTFLEYTPTSGDFLRSARVGVKIVFLLLELVQVVTVIQTTLVFNK